MQSGTLQEMEEQMKLAIEGRQKARRAFRQVRGYPSSSVLLLSKAPKSSQPMEDKAWGEYRRLQKDLLEAEFKLMRIATSGAPISDFEDRFKNRAKTSDRNDITFEIEQLFSCVVSAPVKPLRQYMRKSGTTEAGKQRARRVICRILSGPVKTFIDVADALGTTLLECIQKQAPETRVRLGLSRVLMYISDCYRYWLSYEKSKDAAQFMQIVSPDDPEARMRLGIISALTSDGSDVMKPFFQYCMFLANRKVPIDDREADVVRTFVKDVASKCDRSANSSERSKQNFFCYFVRAVWTVLNEEISVAREKVHGGELWKLFSSCNDDGFSKDEMLDMVGVLIFMHFRTTTKASPGGIQLPQRELADSFVGNFVLITLRHVVKKVKDLYTSLRARRKNRRRALQKKRRHDGTIANPDPNIVIGYDVFKTMIHLDKSVPTFAALSFLTHYWSKARSAPGPSADLKPLGLTLKALQQLLDGLRKIEEITCVIPITSHVDSKMLAGTEGLMPAMPEDLKFCSFLPCQEYSMLHQTSLPPSPLPQLLKRHPGGIIRHVLSSVGSQTYESVASSTSQRHLEAFSQQCINEVGAPFDLLGKEAACELVSMTVRKFRLRRLHVDLEKVAGGRLARMSWQSSSESGGDDKRDVDQSPDVLPLPAQVPSSHLHGSAPAETTTGENLGAKLKKMKRVIGSYTVHEGSQSNLSTDRGSSQAKIDTAQKNALQSPDYKEPGHPKRDRENGRKAMRTSSRGRILSQGSVQLSCVAGQNSDEEAKTARERTAANSKELSRLLHNRLYAGDGEMGFSAGDVGMPAPWRRAPTDELVETVFQSQSFSS